jgi:large subunit ribosomal protein L10
MARPDKVAAVRAVRKRLEEAPATVLTEYRGLSVGELRELRTRLRASGAEYKVVKNTLTRLAAREAGVDLPHELLVGPTAITFCGDDPVAAAKVLRAFSREHPELIVKGSVVEGSLLSAEETLRLADLASREELLSRAAGLFGAVLAQPARLAQANLDKLARLLGALQDKRQAAGESEAPAGAEAAADEPDAADPAAAADEPDAAVPAAAADAGGDAAAGADDRAASES